MDYPFSNISFFQKVKYELWWFLRTFIGYRTWIENLYPFKRNLGFADITVDRILIARKIINILEKTQTIMSGAHRLGVGEINKDLKGEAYLNAIEEEMTGDHAENEGSEQDNEETSDKM